METSDSFVTALSVVEISPNSVNNSRVQDGEGTLATPVNGTEGQTDLQIPEKEYAASNSCCKKAGSNLQQDHSRRNNVSLGTGQVVYDNTPLPVPSTLNLESSSTDESCCAYIARKWEQLGDVPEVSSSGQQVVGAEKASMSAVLELTPNQRDLSHEEGESSSIPEVTFLDALQNGTSDRRMVLQKQKYRNCV